jgi:hypothetical protein
MGLLFLDTHSKAVTFINVKDSKLNGHAVRTGAYYLESVLK